MKLLFDQNLSPFLVKKLASVYPDSVHVRDVNLQKDSDEAVWQYAKKQGLIIVSKDSDFHQRSFLLGHPPKVVWIKKGNCSTSAIESILRQRLIEIRHFAEDKESSFLVLE